MEARQLSGVGGRVVDRVLEKLYIGDARDLALPLASLGFAAAVDLRDGAPPPLSTGVEVLRLPNRDGDPWTKKDIEHALAFIHEHLRHGRVLVACAAGMSRSASITIGYLVRCGWSAPEAIERVRQVRPRIAPVPAMLESVLRAIRG